jgi:hypothetical protein
MFRGNKPCIVALAGERNLYGEEQAPAAGVTERCAVVELIQKAAMTNQRAQMAGSMAHAEDLAITSKIRLEPGTVAVLGAQITVDGVQLRVVSITPKNTTYGQLDHYDVECVPWV